MRLAPPRAPLAALAVVLALGVPLVAGASAPRLVTIDFTLRFTVQNAFDGALSGTFVSSGALVAKGRVAEDYALSPPRRRDGQPVQTVSAGVVMTTREGTLESRYTAVVSNPSVRMTIAEGTWKITGGTGAYAGIRGSGRLAGLSNVRRRTFIHRYDGYLRLP